MEFLDRIDLSLGTTGKGKVCPRTGHEDKKEEYNYSCTLSLTSALEGVGGYRHDPAALPPAERAGYHCLGPVRTGA